MRKFWRNIYEYLGILGKCKNFLEDSQKRTRNNYVVSTLLILRRLFNDVIKTPANIFNGAFLWKCFMAKNCKLFSEKVPSHTFDRVVNAPHNPVNNYELKGNNKDARTIWTLFLVIMNILLTSLLLSWFLRTGFKEQILMVK